MTHTNDSQPRQSNNPAAAAALWASAFIIIAMIITQAGKLGGPVSSAYADVTSAGDLTIITTQGSAGEDIVAVLDRREDMLFLYGIDSARRINLLQFYSVQQLFTDMSGRRGGGGQQR